MRVLTYPSKDFEKEAKSLIANDEEFHVIIPADSKKKEIVLEKLEKMFRRRHDGRSKLGRIIQTCRIMSFFFALGAALTGEYYDVLYEDRGDLVILFKPKQSRGASES